MYKYEIDWILIFNIANSVGSLATFGAFLFLFFKDKQKQNQIDKLTDIFLELQKQNTLSEKKFKISIKPNLYLHGSILSGHSGELQINIHNKGELAIITKLILASNDIISYNENLPWIIENGSSRYFFFRTKGEKNINDCEYEIKIIYEDKAQNEYQIKIRGIGLPAIVEDLQLQFTKS